MLGIYRNLKNDRQFIIKSLAQIKSHTYVTSDVMLSQFEELKQLLRKGQNEMKQIFYITVIDSYNTIHNSLRGFTKLTDAHRYIMKMDPDAIEMSNYCYNSKKYTYKINSLNIEV